MRAYNVDEIDGMLVNIGKSISLRKKQPDLLLKGLNFEPISILFFPMIKWKFIRQTILFFNILFSENWKFLIYANKDIVYDRDFHITKRKEKHAWE